QPNIPTNDNLRPTVDIFGGGPGSKVGMGNYDQSLAIDPLNPNIVYIGGTADALPPGFALIRVDTTGDFDPHKLVPFDAFANDGGQLTGSTTGAVIPDGAFVSDNPATNGKHFINLLKDPAAPFLSNATLFVSGATTFTNTGKRGAASPWFS